MIRFILMILVVAVSCSGPGRNLDGKTEQIGESNLERIVEAISFGGDTLYHRIPDSLQLAKYNALIESLENQGVNTERDYENLGYYYASLNQFNKAIEVYAQGLDRYPESFILMRHRAHRYLSIRKVDSALTDLNLALSFLKEDDSAEIEYYEDGRIKGTYEYWIYYHLGLCHYLNSEFNLAAEAFRACLRTATVPNNKAGATDWLYSSLNWAGQHDEAVNLIQGFQFDSDADTTYAYARRIRLYKGEISPEKFMDTNKPGEDWTGSEITWGYGLANWYMFNEELEKGLAIKNEILKSSLWNAWAYVVTDKELSLL